MQRHDDLHERLGKAILARDAIDTLYAAVFGPSERALHALCASLPLSAIPVAIVWTMFFLLVRLTDSAISLGLYIIGLSVVMLGGGALFVLRSLLGQRALPDELLEPIAAQQGRLAYYPNSVLHQQLRQRGYLVREEFRLWHLRQRDILDHRIRDLKLQAPPPLDIPTHCRHELSASARKLLDS